MAVERERLQAQVPEHGGLNELAEEALLQHSSQLREAFMACRAHTLRLTEPLSPEDMLIQSMPDASPGKWHLAHTTWFFETFILAPYEPGFRWFDESFCVLFNSYYNGIGEQFPRPRRGMISRPDLARVHAYRAQVEGRVLGLLDRLEAYGTAAASGQASAKHIAKDDGQKIASLLRLGINHEQQHQELLLTDIKHALAQNPAWPAYDADGEPPPVSEAGPVSWQQVATGPVTLGFEGAGFHFDNETPAHTALIGDFALASRPVNNSEWLAFMQDGGYEDPLLWLSEGWAWRQENAVVHPMHWRQRDGAWQQFTLRGAQPLRQDLPVAHISYYEADAYARWSGCRLPTEAEWETAIGRQERHGGNTTSDPVSGEFQRLWEWTGSAYLPYPGFNTAAGAVGEYNGKFMINQMVLRGASSATPAGHTRPSYRNFFPAGARWQYNGLRLAKDVKST